MTQTPSIEPAIPQAPAAAPAQPRPSLAVVAFRVAWMAIGLGLLMELVFVGIDFFTGANSEVRTLIADSVQKVSWSFFVCIGLALGTAASNAKITWMGLAGLFAAPIAFAIARVLHKSAHQALQAAGSLQSKFRPSPYEMASVKALEYAFLGIALAWLATRSRSTFRNHFFVGLTAGLVFGGTIVVWRGVSGAPTPSLIALSANEFLFPIGCSCVLFASRALGKHVATDEE
jgi:hypothetical protein